MEQPAQPYRMPVVTDVKLGKQGDKSRAFRAELLCVVAASSIWELGAAAKDHTLRPLFMAYAATEQASRAFTANLRTGRPAVEEAVAPARIKLRFEIPRSSGFQFETHSRDGATLTLAYLRAAFALQPGVLDDERIQFLFMPPRWWVDREAASLPELGVDAREAATAAYFVAYLDERSPLPIANDHRFHLELYRASLAAGWCHQADSSDCRAGELYAVGCEALGFESPLAVSATHAEFSALLAEVTAEHLPRARQEIVHGQTRIRGPRRLLPHAAEPAPHPGLPG